MCSAWPSAFIAASGKASPNVGWAWIVPAEDAVIDERALLAHAREHLAPFKVPRGFTIVTAEALPMTTTGKIQKYLLVASANVAPSPRGA